MYNMMFDYVPEKIQIVGAKAYNPDSGEGKPKVSKMEIARQNNLAMANICENKKDPSISPWMHYLKMVSNKKIVKDIIQKVDKQYDHEQFQRLKSPNLPFYCIDNTKFAELKQLSNEYKKKVMFHMKKELGYAEEPKSGFIDFNRLYEEFEKCKLVHHHGGHKLKKKEEKIVPNNIVITG